MSFLSVYRDPLVARNTAVSDFTLESLMGGPDIDGKPCARKTSFYMVNPPTDADRLKPLTRLLLNQVVRRLTERMDFDESGQGHSVYPHRLLLLIDEFPSLGKLDVFQKALAFIAGYGLKALLIIQSKNQLYGEYTKEEAITDNCQLRIAFTPNRIDSAKELSETAGNFTASHTQRQYSGNRLQVLLQHVNTNEQVVQRPLLTPEEFMRLPATDEVVFMSGHAPIYCQKIIYYTDPVLNKRRAIPPPVLSFPTGSVPAVQEAEALPAAPGTTASVRAETGDAGLGPGAEEDPRAVIARFIGVKPVPANTSDATVVQKLSDERRVPETRGIEAPGDEERDDDPLA